MPHTSITSIESSNQKTIRFHLGYFSLTIVLFIIEFIIAKYITGWVRAYVGDVLVVILIYTAIMAIVNLNKQHIILGTLLFSFIVELSQYFKLAEILGFEKGSLAYIALGNTFSIEDLVCYSVGCVIIWMVEYRLNSNNQKECSC